MSFKIVLPKTISDQLIALRVPIKKRKTIFKEKFFLQLIERRPTANDNRDVDDDRRPNNDDNPFKTANQKKKKK